MSTCAKTPSMWADPVLKSQQGGQLCTISLRRFGLGNALHTAPHGHRITSECLRTRDLLLEASLANCILSFGCNSRQPPPNCSRPLKHLQQIHHGPPPCLGILSQFSQHFSNIPDFLNLSHHLGRRLGGTLGRTAAAPCDTDGSASATRTRPCRAVASGAAKEEFCAAVGHQSSCNTTTCPGQKWNGNRCN